MPATTRARARAETTAAITDIARRHLAVDGAGGLSVRAVARELGVVSSAVYRYVASRDELLTLLIIDAYDAVGAAAEAAADASRRRAPAARWVAVAGAIRAWARAAPHEYALVYGSPVPGYDAPERTIGPATRVSLALLGVVAEAARSGRLEEPAAAAPLPASLRQDLDRVHDALGNSLPAEIPAGALARTLTAWTQLFGAISLELFGQTRNVITDHDALFTTSTRSMAAHIGLAG